MGELEVAIVHSVFLALDRIPILVRLHIGNADRKDVAIAPLVAFLQRPQTGYIV